MCGIIGIIRQKDVVTDLLDCLKRLEYRGYDSAGIAVLYQGQVVRCRSEGKIQLLVEKATQDKIQGSIGIGHTRWATHGAPLEKNAHPHANEYIAVVHNGIIENYESLRQDLKAQGFIFESDTDTEVIVHLMTKYLQQGKTPHDATKATLDQLKGAFALVMLFKQHPDILICARQGSPMAIGIGDNEIYVGSDAMVLAPFTQQICYLKDGDWAELYQSTYQIYDHHHEPVTREIKTTAFTGLAIGKGNYRHFMQKEIFEQPAMAADIVQALIESPLEVPMPKGILTIVACGTSFYAAMVAKNWLEKWAKIRVEVDIASEFRYRQPPLQPGGTAIFISQSGETADTLAALKYAKDQGQYTIGLINVPESSIARACDQAIELKAGPEIGVASTKAFTAQLVVLAFITMKWMEDQGIPVKDIHQAMLEIPAMMNEVLESEKDIHQIAVSFNKHEHVLYMGRGTSYALAMEGALKLKELSYIHAEGYAAGELKHGPIALIEENLPVVTIAPCDDLFEKTVSNIQEIMARQGKAIVLTDQVGAHHFKDASITTVILPNVHPFVAPILYVLPLQLLSYHTAVLKGTDVDQPRNLAKSVTVE